MLTKPLAIVALAASGAVAQLPLQARVLDDLDESPSCASARDSVLSVYAQMPTPAAVLDDAVLPTGVCEEPSFAGETARAWSSYTSAAMAVIASHTADIASAFSACPDLVGRLPDVPDCVATATTAPTPAPTGAGASSSKSGSGTPAAATGSQSGAASSPTPDTNAAPRLGTIFGTILGAAGLLGVVAAL